jgi:alpha-ribazole phosphatase CobZ
MLSKEDDHALEAQEKRDIVEVLKENGITIDDMVNCALSLYVPHPGVENRERAKHVFLREMEHALSDPNLSLLIYAGLLLEAEGKASRLPGITKADYDADLTYLIADEVLGMSIAKYVGGYKGSFEYVRFDKAKPGILGTLGPFMDDVIGGLIGGVSSNMYSRAMMHQETK